MDYNSDNEYCSHFQECRHGKYCPFALTDKVKRAAEKYNKEIKLFTSKPDCFEQQIKRIKK